MKFIHFTKDYCPKCDSIRLSGNYCRECGTKLEVAPKEHILCSACKRKNATYYNYCVYCGSKLNV